MKNSYRPEIIGQSLEILKQFPDEVGLARVVNSAVWFFGQLMQDKNFQAARKEHGDEWVLERMRESFANGQNPLWDSAPEWARWFACDSDGNSYWYENEPQLGMAGGFYWADGKTELANKPKMFKGARP